jgi:hypothetical protein
MSPARRKHRYVVELCEHSIYRVVVEAPDAETAV